MIENGNCPYLRRQSIFISSLALQRFLWKNNSKHYDDKELMPLLNLRKGVPNHDEKFNTLNKL